MKMYYDSLEKELFNFNLHMVIYNINIASTNIKSMEEFFFTNKLNKINYIYIL